MIYATITGNLGTDAEIKRGDFYTLVSFRMASNTKIKGEERTEWIEVGMFCSPDRAEALVKYLKKGKQICAVGTLESRAFMRKNGDPGCGLDLKARDIDFMGSSNSEPPSAPLTQTPQAAAMAAQAPEGQDSTEADDVPF